MKRVELSIQARALIEAWNDTETQGLARIKMIKKADHVLEYELKHTAQCGGDLYDPRNKHNWSEFAYMHVLNDGMFEPITDDGQTQRAMIYREVIEEHGNEDDETCILTCYWIQALTAADPVKYMPIIMKLMDIAVNGL